MQGKVSQEDWDTLRAILLVEPWLYHKEMAAALLEETGRFYTHRQIRQVLKKNRYTRRVICYYAKQQNEELKEHFRGIVQDQALFSAEHFVFFDESHCKDKARRRRYGYGPQAQRVIGRAPPPGLERISTIAAMTIEGLACLKTIDVVADGQVTTDTVMDFLNNHLLPLCNAYPSPMSVLVCDNARTHKKHLISTACAAKGVLVLFLPPYVPEFNPIENLFNCAKSMLKRGWGTEACERSLLEHFEHCLFNAVTPSQACNLFRHCGVPVSAQAEAWANR